MDKATFEQGSKLFASFAEQHPTNSQVQGIIGSGVIKLLCRADLAKYNPWKVAQALGFCEPRRITVPSRDNLLAAVPNAVKRGLFSCEKVPDSFFGDRSYDLDVALFPFGSCERQTGHAQLIAQLNAVGYCTPEFHEMVAFALSTDREQFHKLWPLALRRGFIAVGSLQKLSGNFDGETGFTWVIYRDEEKIVSIYDHLPDWDNGFILGVKTAR